MVLFLCDAACLQLWTAGVDRRSDYDPVTCVETANVIFYSRWHDLLYVVSAACFCIIKNGGSITEMINLVNERRSIRKYEERVVMLACGYCMR